ncbi:hypothetical protein M427DRAFT_141326 [Gonapodya prolifera JEL478]|uniref:FYVE-type domain-containing protein n=1 Tax=Gonapodya prolifera (strain JEL478) TaxID=1344416 RepID=A0A138ZXF7_GONPJ|nr:hypothetical protein M427DRAFT_141326 [Gonapodya prolifera JEL478]|eukprot:KXS09188.1 hypothetical protein M427DRAFT_141326 [Gonapodya prolifera JEL478]
MYTTNTSHEQSFQNVYTRRKNEPLCYLPTSRSFPLPNRAADTIDLLDLVRGAETTITSTFSAAHGVGVLQSTTSASPVLPLSPRSDAFLSQLMSFPTASAHFVPIPLPFPLFIEMDLHSACAPPSASAIPSRVVAAAEAAVFGMGMNFGTVGGMERLFTSAGPSQFPHFAHGLDPSYVPFSTPTAVPSWVLPTNAPAPAPAPSPTQRSEDVERNEHFSTSENTVPETNAPALAVPPRSHPVPIPDVEPELPTTELVSSLFQTPRSHASAFSDDESSDAEGQPDRTQVFKSQRERVRPLASSPSVAAAHLRSTRLDTATASSSSGDALRTRSPDRLSHTLTYALRSNGIPVHLLEVGGTGLDGGLELDEDVEVDVGVVSSSPAPAAGVNHLIAMSRSARAKKRQRFARYLEERDAMSESCGSVPDDASIVVFAEAEVKGGRRSVSPMHQRQSQLDDDHSSISKIDASAKGVETAHVADAGAVSEAVSEDSESECSEDGDDQSSVGSSEQDGEEDSEDDASDMTTESDADADDCDDDVALTHLDKSPSCEYKSANESPPASLPPSPPPFRKDAVAKPTTLPVSHPSRSSPPAAHLPIKQGLNVAPLESPSSLAVTPRPSLVPERRRESKDSERTTTETVRGAGREVAGSDRVSTSSSGSSSSGSEDDGEDSEDGEYEESDDESEESEDGDGSEEEYSTDEEESEDDADAEVSDAESGDDKENAVEKSNGRKTEETVDAVSRNYGDAPEKPAQEESNVVPTTGGVHPSTSTQPFSGPKAPESPSTRTSQSTQSPNSGSDDQRGFRPGHVIVRGFSSTASMASMHTSVNSASGSRRTAPGPPVLDESAGDFSVLTEPYCPSLGTPSFDLTPIEVAGSLRYFPKPAQGSSVLAFQSRAGMALNGERMERAANERFRQESSLKRATGPRVGLAPAARGRMAPGGTQAAGADSRNNYVAPVTAGEGGRLPLKRTLSKPGMVIAGLNGTGGGAYANQDSNTSTRGPVTRVGDAGGPQRPTGMLPERAPPLESYILDEVLPPEKTVPTPSRSIAIAGKSATHQGALDALIGMNGGHPLVGQLPQVQITDDDPGYDCGANAARDPLYFSLGRRATSSRVRAGMYASGASVVVVESGSGRERPLHDFFSGRSSIFGSGADTIFGPSLSGTIYGTSIGSSIASHDFQPRRPSSAAGTSISSRNEPDDVEREPLDESSDAKRDGSDTLRRNRQNVNAKDMYAEPTRRHWKADHDVSDCGICRTKFNLLVRRHHCRMCGGIFCGRCSQGRERLTQDCRPDPFGVSSRVCDVCRRSVATGRPHT